ncbi:CAP domain-containing protein [Pleurocapsa sp. FMAR1]|uniref:CAP domain-containing protein n=1 Tax=Pleurocapsa sp. FMAR1 TaxID=3040204 RepID=UPI0029C9A415|nr:CAP domain-containing protein [Pleurocapsa sp. FMAR1]
MFKSRISLQTALPAKIFLSTAVITMFTWTVSSKVYSQEYTQKSNSVAATQRDEELSNLAQQVHQQVNKYRASVDLAPLKLNTQISNQAQIHSQNMAQQKVEFGHQGFDSRIEALKNNIAYSRAAENVAYNQGYGDPASEAVKGWIKSEGHRQNMVGNYNLTGIGVAKNQQGEYYFTQIFILE